MPLSLEEGIRTAEEFAERGNLSSVKAWLRSLTLKNYSREEKLRIASLARRIGLPRTSLRILGPVVRAGSALKVPPTDEEKTVYAASLIRIGAPREARELLAEVDSDKVPDALLFTSHSLVSEWRYEESIPILEEYLEKKLDDRQHVLGELNLAAAHVHLGQFKKAAPILEELIPKCMVLGLHFLAGNALELCAQHAIGMGNWALADRYLKQAEKPLSEGGLSRFFVDKWSAIATAISTHNSSVLASVRKNAMKEQHWETVRDVDLYAASIDSNLELLKHLYYGTPYESFRSRIFQVRPDFVYEDYYVWNSGKGRKTVDLLEDGFLDIRAGGQPYRLCALLISDFYRPFRIATIFDEIQPGECFALESSIDRVQQAVKKLRSALERKRLPVSIEALRGSYRLQLSSKIAIRVPRKAAVKSTMPLRFESLRRFEERVFSVQELEKELGLSRRTANRLLKEAVEQKFIRCEGKGRSTRYRLIGA